MVTDGFSKFILSNNHILANKNKLLLDTPIVHPSIKDKGKPNIDIIGFLSKFVPLKFSTLFKKPENYVDCAIARLADKSIASPNSVLIGNVNGVQQVKLNESVKKVGTTSELTTGKVTAINTTYTVGYGLKNVLFKEQILTTFMAEEGDSGAVLLNDNNYIVGLLLGGNALCSIFNNIEKVLSLLSVGFVK